MRTALILPKLTLTPPTGKPKRNFLNSQSDRIAPWLRTPQAGSRAAIRDIAAFLARKAIDAKMRARMNADEAEGTPLALMDMLEIAAPHYREECRRLIDILSYSRDSAARAYARIAARMIDKDSPSEIRQRHRHLTKLAGEPPRA